MVESCEIHTEPVTDESNKNFGKFFGSIRLCSLYIKN